MIPMWVVWAVRGGWVLAFLFWIVCLVNFIVVRRAYKKARQRILPELEKLGYHEPK